MRATGATRTKVVHERRFLQDAAPTLFTKPKVLRRSWLRHVHDNVVDVRDGGVALPGKRLIRRRLPYNLLALQRSQAECRAIARIFARWCEDLRCL